MIAPDRVGPRRERHELLGRADKRRCTAASVRRHVLPGDARDDAMANAAPRPDRACGGDEDEAREGESGQGAAHGVELTLKAMRGTIVVRSLTFRRSTTDDRRPPKPARAKAEGGKSELHRAVHRVTPGRGDSKESGTENTQLTFAFARASNGEKVR